MRGRLGQQVLVLYGYGGTGKQVSFSAFFSPLNAFGEEPLYDKVYLYI